MKYTKNINYHDAGYLLKYANNGLSGDPIEAMVVACQYIQVTSGAQMVVASSVVDELELSDVSDSVRFADVPWPNQSLEFYFEQPNLPTLLVTCLTAREIEAHGIKTKTGGRYTPDERLVRIFVFGGESGYECNAVSYSFADMDRFVRHDKSVAYQLQGTHALTESEENDMRRFAALIFKVLVYAAVPRCAPVKASRRDLHYGGKSGVRGRPVRPILRVVSLPPHIHSDAHKSDKSESASDVKRKFLGRRGHFHFYRHDRFVNRKGQFDYFPAIQGAQNVKTVFKVR